MKALSKKQHGWAIITNRFSMMIMLFILAVWLTGGRIALAQEVPTATPDADGFIYAVVQPNDSMWAVAARAGISLDELLTFNALTEDDVIQPGQQLIVGIGAPPPTATVLPPMPTETATLPPPTPTNTAVPQPPTGICLTAFSDLNENGIFEGNEPLKSAVAFTIFNADVVIANYVTDGVSEPICLDGFVAGEYQVTRSISPRETLTTPGNRGIIVRVGLLVELEFGSIISEDGTPLLPTAVLPTQIEQADDKTAVVTSIEPPKTSNMVPILILLVGTGGIILLLSAIFFIIRLRKK
ncbi:MAG: LysM peptidoglycan-binding domain-containing protein [Chloroflexi bacterium]|nr:LysM peptidoglycan-binding domain-containing protein [Chloroflexota bacterium]